MLKEIDDLKKNEILVGTKKIEFDINVWIGDAPARSAATGTCSHTGKKGCPVCHQEGGFVIILYWVVYPFVFAQIGGIFLSL